MVGVEGMSYHPTHHKRILGVHTRRMKENGSYVCTSNCGQFGKNVSWFTFPQTIMFLVQSITKAMKKFI